jgi:ABC-type transport system substrate-binding protein
MKSKKWLISLGLAVVLVMAFALPACNGTPKEYWHTPGGEKISFKISSITGPYYNIALLVAENLQDLGLDVTVEAIDSSTYYDYLYQPDLGGMEAFVSAEDPSPDPWSDWIWMMLGDPEDWGYMWNPTWWTNSTYDELFQQNYFAPTLDAKKDIIFEMQEILANELPVIYLVREDIISVYREENWDNWFNELGGPCTWINEYSMREVTQAGDETQLNIGTIALMSNLLMDQESLMYTNAGCLYLMMVYENLAGYPKVDEASVEANPLVAYDFVPKLATAHSWDYEADGTGGQNQILTIDLREGVKWHDGENFTADDVVYTLKYVTNKWGNNKPINWTAVEDAGGEEILPEHVLVTKTGDYQVEFRFVEGYHQNEEYFPSVYMWDAVVPEHVFGPAGNGTQEGWNEDPLSWDGNYIGTGPYKVLEWEQDEYLLLERFDDYWGDGVEGWGLPEAQQILWKLFPDYGQMWISLEAGEIDTTMGSGAPFAKYDAYMANAELTVEVVKDLSVNYMGFNLHPTAGYEPLQDLALREAIAAAIDKENIVDVAFGGYGEAADAFVYNESGNHNPSLPNNEYDPTEAASILTAAGYTKHAAE